MCACVYEKTEHWLIISAIIDRCLFCMSGIIHFHFGSGSWAAIVNGNDDDPEVTLLQSLPTPLCYCVSFSPFYKLSSCEDRVAESTLFLTLGWLSPLLVGLHNPPGFHLATKNLGWKRDK